MDRWSVGQRNEQLLGPMTTPANYAVVHPSTTPMLRRSTTPFSAAGFERPVTAICIRTRTVTNLEGIAL
jgi:hypothetical protein